MKILSQLILIAIVAVAAAAGGFWFAKHGGEKDEATTQPAEDDKPVAEVTTAPLKMAAISETITAYGSVVAQPEDVRIISVPFESRVDRLLVTAGQQVAAGGELIQVEASADALVTLQEAKNAVEAAQRDQKQTEQRFAEHLATNTELSQAQQALASAKLKLDSLTQRGVAAPQKLKSESVGIINKIDVQEGQIVPAGGALLQIASGTKIEVALSVEPEDAVFLKPGQEVQLAPVGRAAGEKITGKIRVIGQRVDPATRLVQVIVSLPADAHLMLETFVSGKITKASAQALIVPREALLAQEDGQYALFTVTDGHAVKHLAHLGLESDRECQVIADDLKAGEPVVILGNYELEDGMAVKVAR